jgi:hypothetical protein
MQRSFSGKAKRNRIGNGDSAFGFEAALVVFAQEHKLPFGKSGAGNRACAKRADIF